ncbi:unnamed protein product [Pedinophyceae sp. YPF-701]|nr:unnamed protein product [Pedinophyceae sp. YPF-701]
MADDYIVELVRRLKLHADEDTVVAAAEQLGVFDVESVAISTEEDWMELGVPKLKARRLIQEAAREQKKCTPFGESDEFTVDGLMKRVADPAVNVIDFLGRELVGSGQSIKVIRPGVVLKNGALRNVQLRVTDGANGCAIEHVDVRSFSGNETSVEIRGAKGVTIRKCTIKGNSSTGLSALAGAEVRCSSIDAAQAEVYRKYRALLAC